MSATNHTPNLKLSQFIPLDKPAWLGDYNSDMSKIDTAVHKVQTQADSMGTAVEQATTAAQAATQAAQAATGAAQNAADKAQDAETTANNIAGSLAGKVNKTGDTMTGPLVLPGDPTSDLQAATKKYVDEHSGGLPLTGGTLKGSLKFDKSVTNDLQFLGASPNETVVIENSDGFQVLYPDAGWMRYGAAGLTFGSPTQISNVKNPVNPQDAATKAYVDAKAGGAVTAYTNFTPGENVSGGSGCLILIGKLIIADISITLNGQISSGGILGEFVSTDLTAQDQISVKAYRVNGSGNAVVDLKMNVFGGNVKFSYTGTFFGASGDVYHIVAYGKQR